MSTLKANAFQDTNGNILTPARLWGCLNTLSSNSILNDQGLSSFTDNTTGDYTLNFSFTTSTSSYAFSGSGRQVVNHPIQTVGVSLNASPSTTTIRIMHGRTGGAGSVGQQSDADNISVQIHY